MNRLSSEIAAALIDQGASLVGFAGLSALPKEKRHGMDFAVSIAAALDPAVVGGITGGPTHAYHGEYKRANALLADLSRAAARLLAGKGFRAVALKPAGEDFDQTALATSSLPHKTAATRAGLGWIGKSALLVTKRFGAAVRLTTVLTDAPLKVAVPVTASRCGKCTACIDACPGRAPAGREWEAGLEREAFFDARACYQTAKGYAASLQIESTICGICIAACPWTKKYTRLKP
jgi:epoxyqueuosine reductase QueG